MTNDTSSTDKQDLYKDSVFLPKTEFPMRAGLAQKEPDILKKWEDMNLYQKMRDQGKDRKKWVLHWGPPYANGHAHIGHAFTKSLKDVVNRSWQMMGYDAALIPGWDCHGLPIEWKIEEKYREQNKDKDEADPLVFRQECRDFAQKWVDIQSSEFQRLGVIADWDNPYLTMTNQAEAGIVREIHKFLENKLLYEGVKPVMWSVVEKTALAEAEVEYKEHKSITIWIKFPVVKTNCEALKDSSIVIWTTTPWTMPSNRALAYGEDIQYAVYEIQSVKENSRAKVGDKIALAISLADDVKEKAQIEQWTQTATFSGSEVEGTVCAHPLRGKGYEFDVPVLLGDFVTDDAGTGFVHIAPGHGADDFFLGQANGVEVTDNVSDDGFFRDHVPLFAGLAVYTDKGELGDGNFAVLKEMNEAGALLAKGSLRHEYPHSWRSKAPLIFRTTPQWFIAMDQAAEGESVNLRDKALEEIKKTNWVPKQGEKRISAMIEQRPDWCISRQRAWGVPIAIFVHKETGEPLRDRDVLERIGDIFEQEGSDAWWKRPAQDFLGNGYDADDYRQIYDIVDVWFESGSTHAFVVEQRDELQWPADLYLEGSDQHRGWFHSSLLESVGTRGTAPYKNVLTHGFILDEKGYKMSKSMGNVVAPSEVWDEYGADILRLWSITVDYTEDVSIGQNILKSTGDIYRRIRNTFRFLLGGLEGMTSSDALSPEEYKDMPELERLVLHWLHEMDQEVRQDIQNYQFNRLAHRLHNFCTNELSSFYFDIRKDRLYCDHPDSFDRKACRTVMMHVFDCLTTWLAPILCFTTEEAWSHRPESLFEEAESIHLRTFPDIPESWKDESLDEKWDLARKVRKVILGALEPKRADKTIGSSLEAAPVIYLSEEMAKTLENVNMAELGITSQASVDTANAPDDAFSLNDVKDVSVVFQKAEGQKCDRCWQVLPEVGLDSEHPSLCNRCIDAVQSYNSEKKVA